MKINIAIDGYSSCGKSTLAKSLAQTLKYTYIDSGAMYRSVTLYALEAGLVMGKAEDVDKLIERLDDISIHFEFNKEIEMSETYLNGRNVENKIRQMYVAEQVSTVSKLPQVRQKLVAMQREMGQNKGVVMDGRDIGTVVFPDAELKIFMTASQEIRAQRRYDELKSKGAMISLQEVIENLQERDYQDSNRKESPLRQADDASVIDNSHLTTEDQLQLALSWAEEKIGA